MNGNIAVILSHWWMLPIIVTIGAFVFGPAIFSRGIMDEARKISRSKSHLDMSFAVSRVRNQRLRNGDWREILFLVVVANFVLTIFVLRAHVVEINRLLPW